MIRGKKIIGYTMGIIPHRTRSLPFLVPFTAYLNREENKIGSFIGFDNSTFPDLDLTDEQLFLHEHCEAFAEVLQLRDKQKIGKNIFTQMNKDHFLAMAAFKSWQSILPTLKNQRYLTYYWFTRKIVYNKKPVKFKMRPVRFSTDQLEYKFMVREHRDHFTVQMKAVLNGKNVEISNVFPQYHPFFIRLKSDPWLHYMLPSLDFGMYIQDFVREGFTHRICKTVFDGFKKHVLDHLAVDYPVKYNLL